MQRIIDDILELADIRVGGGRPGDPVANDSRVYRRIFGGGSLALGETYMDGGWDCDRLDVFFHKLLRARLNEKVRPGFSFYLNLIEAWVLNLQSRARAFHIGERHYDAGNDLFQRMLDKRMQYSCAVWDGISQPGDINAPREQLVAGLDAAQEAKLDRICRKLKLEKGMSLLDIGCGWGGLAQYASERYGVRCVGITVSENQAALARERCKGLPVEIRVEDYRMTRERFDRIVSVGMFEHVGVKNYKTYFRTAKRALALDGIFLLHTIVGEKSEIGFDPWYLKYIFPNTMLPSVCQITHAAEDLFVLENAENIGPHYANTLLAWKEKFNASWDEIKSEYDDRFRRMWNYYLCCSAGTFSSRMNQVWQFVFTPEGMIGGAPGVLR